MLKNNLINILKDLDSIKSHDEIILSSINEKLENSCELYLNNIKKLCKYLLSRDNFKVIKEISSKK